LHFLKKYHPFFKKCLGSSLAWTPSRVLLDHHRNRRCSSRLGTTSGRSCCWRFRHQSEPMYIQYYCHPSPGAGLFETMIAGVVEHELITCVVCVLGILEVQGAVARPLQGHVIS